MRRTASVLAWLIPASAALLSSIIFFSCASPSEAVKPSSSPVSTTTTAPVKKLAPPDGWIAVSAGQRSAQGEIRLVRIDSAASMVLKELKPVASAKELLTTEDVCVLGNISMQSKLVDVGARRRVLRAPSVIGNGTKFCVYLYSEDSLLRRVLVFRSRSSIYEIELIQENESLLLSTVIEAQMAFARSFVNGE